MCGHIGIRVIAEEDTVADIVIIAGPKLTSRVVGTDNDVTILRKADWGLIFYIRTLVLIENPGRLLNLAEIVGDVLAQIWNLRGAALGAVACSQCVVLLNVARRRCGHAALIHVLHLSLQDILIARCEGVVDYHIVHGEADDLIVGPGCRF